MSSEGKRHDVGEFAEWWQQTGEYELRQILHWRWDPIGVSVDFPYAAGEYDSYAPEVFSVLSNGASANEIAELLGSIEDERMGLGAGPLSGAQVDRLRDVAAGIVAWFEASRLRWVEFGPLRR
jgi:hypothetical protein